MGTLKGTDLGVCAYVPFRRIDTAEPSAGLRTCYEKEGRNVLEFKILKFRIAAEFFPEIEKNGHICHNNTD